MELSIVIVNWNTKAYLERCLQSLQANAPSCESEVIVVDNASDDGSAPMVRERFPEAILIENAENAGYARGNNQGIERSKGEYLLLLNPDTEVTTGALDSLLEFARKHKDAAAVGCRLIGPDGKVQPSCRSFPEPRGVFFEYTKLSRLFPKSRILGAYRMTWFDYAREAEVDQPMGSCLLLNRKAIEQIGDFDEDFPVFFNEVDWCYRAKQKSWKIYFTPKAEVLHHGGASTRQKKPEMIRESHRSLKKFYEKHYRRQISLVIYWPIVFAIEVNSFLASRIRFFGRS